MAANPLSLGPWRGIDNVHAPDAQTFQIPGERERRIASLVTATDVDLDDDGWPKTRKPATDLITLTSGLRGVSFGGAMILQDAGELVQFDTDTEATSTLVSGLVPESAALCAHAGQLFWSDGVKLGRLDADLTPLNWGMDICPTPTLTAVYGNLEPGEYLVAGEYIDASGVVHASDTAGSITLASTGGIQVSLASLDPDAEYVRLYLAGPNDDVLYLLGDVPLNYFPYTINSLPQEDTTCWTIGLSPPQPCDFIFSYGDRLMLVEDQWIYPSVGTAHHLYDIGTTTIARPETILAAGGLVDGFWTVSARGAYWASGDQIGDWRTQDRREKAKFCAGSLLINTADVPALGIDPSPAVLFWCNWSLAVGLPGGTMIFPTRSSYNMDVTGKTARFTLHDDGSDLKQLIVVVS